MKYSREHKADKMEQIYSKFGWKENPFTLKIDPSLFVGYSDQVRAIENHISSKHKIATVVGPTGSGKTTLLKWLDLNLEVSKLYISKPPKTPEEFIQIFTGIYKLSLFERLFGLKPNLYNLPNWINKRLNGSQLVFMVDEAHETNRDVLEWLRVLVDQINNVSLILAGLPSLEKEIKEKLETLDQRITTRITLNSLTESETKELIRKRIESVGGNGIKPFTDSAISAIYKRTGGFPREVIKMCDKLLNEAIANGTEIIEYANIEEYREIKPENKEQTVMFSPKPPSKQQIDNLPSKQRSVLEILAKADWLTPSSIVDQLDMTKYSSRGHAVRSIDNILHRLMLDGFVQREERGKTFMYALTPKVKTIFVET